LFIGKRLVVDETTTYFRLDLPKPITLEDQTIETLVLFLKYNHGIAKYNEEMRAKLFLVDLANLQNPNSTILRKDQLNFWLNINAHLVADN
jgi:hypothetical protein